MSVLIKEKSVRLHGNGISRLSIVRNSAGKRSPVILIYTPYPRDSVIQKFCALHLAKEGWVIVVASTRGRHGSSGNFEPFINDNQDSKTILNWCINQPWSDSRVVMMGASYEGFAQWQCANGNKDLKAIIPSITASNLWDWFYENGAFKHAFTQSWGLSLVYTNDQFVYQKIRKEVKKFASDLKELYSIPPLSSPLINLLPGYANWLNTSTSFWEQIRNSGHPVSCDVPVYFCTGWNDIFLTGAINDFLARKSKRKDRLVIGPWSHDSIGKTIDGDINFGFHSDNETFNVLSDQISWLWSILSRRKKKIPKVSFFLMGKNEWVHSNTWPVKHTVKRLKLGLEKTAISSKNTLFQKEITFNKTALEIRISPDKVPSSFGGKKHDPSLPKAGCAILNLWILETKPLLFVSNQYTSSCNIAGELTMNVSLSANVDVFDIYVVVGVFNKKKQYMGYLEGINRITTSASDGKKVLRIGPTAFTVLENEQLFVALTGGCFPNYDNPYQHLKKTVIIKLLGQTTINIPIMED